MSRRESPSAGKVYGVRRVCEAWAVPRSSFYAWRKAQACDPGRRKRRGPVGNHTDAEIVEQIRQILAASPFTGEGYRKVWARLRWRGIRCGEPRVQRVMREHSLQAPTRVGRPRGPRAHDGTIATEHPDEMWGTDMTSTVLSTGRQVSVFVAVDHCGIYCTGLHAAARGTRWEALEPIRQGVKAAFGRFDEGMAAGLQLRHDHGSQYVADDFQNEVSFVGIEPSPAFVREPEGNGCAEWFIRVLKENLLWARTFDSVEELRQALIEFKHFYNHEWLMGKHGNKTPAQIRTQRQSCAQAAA